MADVTFASVNTVFKKKTKTGSEKEMIITIYDILSENNFPSDKIGELAIKIINLARRHL